MADALISPAVGGVLWGATAVTVAYSARKVRNELDESKIPLMGVAGAFVFAAQMLNIAIPGTGSSGHLGGALILAILLGPEAAFLVIASVLAVQALFFADGGLLALGCNIFNLGFFPAFIAYPLIYRKIVGRGPELRAGHHAAGAQLGPAADDLAVDQRVGDERREEAEVEDVAAEREQAAVGEEQGLHGENGGDHQESRLRPRRMARISAPPRCPLEPVPGIAKLSIWAAKTKAPATPINGILLSSSSLRTLRAL